MVKSEAIFLVKKGEAKHAFMRKEITLPPLNKGEVIIHSEAFGLNYADVMARNGLYREAPPMPCVIGYEVVGKVLSVGPEGNSDLIASAINDLGLIVCNDAHWAAIVCGCCILYTHFYLFAVCL